MSIAPRAEDFDPAHSIGAVLLVDDVLCRDWLKKTGPAGAGIELRVRGEERQVAANAGVDALSFVVEQCAAKRPFGAFASCNFVLLAGELLAPFGIALLDARQIDRPDELTIAIEHPNFHTFVCHRLPLSCSSEQPHTTGN